MTRKSLRPADRDRFQRRAGLALYESAPTCGSLAVAMDCRPETASRTRNGHRPNTLSRYLEIIHRLAANPETTPFPLLSSAEITALEGMMAGMDERALVRRYWMLKDEAAEAQREKAGAEAVAAETGDLAPLEAAEAHVMDAAKEGAVIVRLLRKHKIDPRDPDWRQ